MLTVRTDRPTLVILRGNSGSGKTSVAREALGHGYHVILEGVLGSGTYGTALRELRPDHVFYLDVSLGETLRRHAGRPGLAHVTPEMMRGWYRPLDLLGVPGEQIVPEPSPLERTVTTILHVSGLAAALARCHEARPAAVSATVSI